MKSRNIRKIVSFFLLFPFSISLFTTPVRAMENVAPQLETVSTGDAESVQQATPVPSAEPTATPEAVPTASPAVTPAVASVVQSAFGTGTASGSITLDGSLTDWENVAEISVGINNIKGWKAALSPDETVLYLAMYGETLNEWDYNFQWSVLSFQSESQTVSCQFGGLTGQMSGAEVAMKNTANGNVKGEFAVEAAIPVSYLPQDAFTLTIAGQSIASTEIPVLDGVENVPVVTPVPVYNGITIDGDFQDWNAVTKVPGNCPNSEHPRCLSSVAMVFDGDYVYIYLESGDSSNGFWGSSHSNSKYAITTDLGYSLLFTITESDTVSGVDGAVCRHYGNQAEVAIPKSALPEYQQSLSFGFYLVEPMIKDVVNLVPEDNSGKFDGIVYDGLYGDWTYYPHTTIEYATAGTQENVVDAVGALYSAGNQLFGHVKVTMQAHMNEQRTLFTEAVTFKFGESGKLVFYPRAVTVDEAGNIDWNPQTNGLENGTYEYYLASIDAWHTSTNISDLNENDRMYGKMVITISDTGRECEFYLDLDAIAEKLGCNAEEFKVIKAQFGRIGQQWLVTAGASSGAYAGVLACVATVAVVWGIQKKRKGTIG